jgi:transposase
MVNISDDFYKLLGKLVNDHNNNKKGREKCGKKPTVDTKHYCNVIMKVLTTGCQWNSLTEKLHFSVYNKKFIEWTDEGIVENFYYLLTLVNDKLKKFNNNFYIDTTIFRNMQGIEDISYNHKIKSKRGTKLSILVDSNGIPVSLVCVSAKHNDVTLVLPNYHKLNDKIKNNISNIICDKGYISRALKDYFRENNNINYIYPDKKNTLPENKNLENDNILLKTRSINENSFSWMTQYRRLTARYEKYTKNFLGFIMLAFSNIIINKLSKLTQQ